MSGPKYLLDVNVVIALTDEDHTHRALVMDWFRIPELDWGLCAFSEAGFLRISANPRVGGLTLEEASRILSSLTKLSGYRFWPVASGWSSLAAPFAERVFGHQQVTDAYLLGLAISENGVLVTLDKTITYMAGLKYGTHVLVLE